MDSWRKGLTFPSRSLSESTAIEPWEHFKGFPDVSLARVPEEEALLQQLLSEHAKTKEHLEILEKGISHLMDIRKRKTHAEADLARRKLALEEKENAAVRERLRSASRLNDALDYLGPPLGLDWRLERAGTDLAGKSATSAPYVSDLARANILCAKLERVEKALEEKDEEVKRLHVELSERRLAEADSRVWSPGSAQGQDVEALLAQQREDEELLRGRNSTDLLALQELISNALQAKNRGESAGGGEETMLKTEELVNASTKEQRKRKRLSKRRPPLFEPVKES